MGNVHQIRSISVASAELVCGTFSLYTIFKHQLWKFENFHPEDPIPEKILSKLLKMFFFIEFCDTLYALKYSKIDSVIHHVTLKKMF